MAADDPELATFEGLGRSGLADVRVLPDVGCEAVARLVHAKVAEIVAAATEGRAWVESVEVMEHGGNSALFSLA